MKKGLHAYALIFGIGIGIMVLFALRHPLFAIFAAVAATVLIDYGLKARKIKNDKDDGDDKGKFQ